MDNYGHSAHRANSNQAALSEIALAAGNATAPYDAMGARHWHQLVTVAEEETDRLLQGLPAELREPASSVPVVFQPWADNNLAGTDLEADVLGLFVGTPHGDEESVDPMPPQIFLFLESIWASVDSDPAQFREEVGVTYLHELGHYLGLDEHDLLSRGLD